MSLQSRRIHLVIDGRYPVKEIVSTLTSKGQVTVPAEVRKHLGVSRGDKLSFVIDDEGMVQLKPPRYSSVLALRGAAGKLKKPLAWKETLKIAREDGARQELSGE